MKTYTAVSFVDFQHLNQCGPGEIDRTNADLKMRCIEKMLPEISDGVFYRLCIRRLTSQEVQFGFPCLRIEYRAQVVRFGEYYPCEAAPPGLSFCRASSLGPSWLVRIERGPSLA